ncbi:hypothetical protein KXX11_003281, partial [Aspergillus fumigatus]
PGRGAAAGLAGAAPGGIALDLAHAHRGGTGHGHDRVHHRLGPDPGVRPHGRAELRPWRVHRPGGLRRHQRAGRHGRLDRLGRAVAQPGGGVPGHAGGHGGGRCPGPGLRALHRAPGLRPASQADPHHHGRHDHRRRADQGDLGPRADPAAAARGHARRLGLGRCGHRALPGGGGGGGPAGVRRAVLDTQPHQDRPAHPCRLAGLPHRAPFRRRVRGGQRAGRPGRRDVGAVPAEPGAADGRAGQ